MEALGMSAALIWLLIALVLGGLEILTLSFFLLWPALAALVVSLLTLLFPEMAWGWQIVIFALIAVALLIPGRRWLKRSKVFENEHIINDRGTQLVGRLGNIVSGKDGIYRVKLGDTEWSARGEKSLAKNEQVRVNGVDGITLLIERA